MCLHAPTHTRCVAALSFPESPCVKETDGALFRKRMQTERRMGGRTGGGVVKQTLSCVGGDLRETCDLFKNCLEIQSYLRECQ